MKRLRPACLAACDSHVHGIYGFGAGCKRVIEFIRAGDQAKQGLNYQKRRVMVASRQLVSDSTPSTVCQQHTPVIPEHRISNRRVHTNTRCAAGEDQVVNSQSAQSIIQLRLKEAAEPVLIEDHVVLFRLKLPDDVGIPCVTD